MDEDRFVRLLEEIRDLQRQQVEAYGRAVLVLLRYILRHYA